MMRVIDDVRRARAEREGPAGRHLARILRWLAVTAAAGMCLVLQQGTLVTNSGSAAGCGNTWPLCHGQILPEFSGVGGAATLIEFTHRVAVPIESTLILLLSAGILWFWWGRWEAFVLAPSMVLFLFLQAVLGALAVEYPTSAGVLAAHFGISLMAFASVVLAAVFVLEIGKAELLRDRPLSLPLRWLIRATLVYTYAVVYLGAYVRHVGASLSCLDWPLCNGRVIPRFVGEVAVQFAHRLAAACLVVLLVGLFMLARRARASRPDLYWASAASMVLVVMQAVSGAIVVESQVAVLSTLLHAFVVSLLFCVEAYMWMHTLELPAAARRTALQGEQLSARVRGAAST
jgi:cytochrome c oxidase assembly protein subunit 15